MTKPTIASLKRDKAKLLRKCKALSVQLFALRLVARHVVKASAHQWPVDGMAELARAVKGADDE